MGKKLYVLICDGGDGSYYPKYTLDFTLIAKMQEAYDLDLMDYENGIGVDGDGFHYSTINVPEDATEESLGIRCIHSDFADQFFGEDNG